MQAKTQGKEHNALVFSWISQFDGKPWRAMLIKDNEGDWGICIAAWVGMEPGRPGKPGTRWERPVKGVAGKPGYFKMLFQNLR